MRLLIPTRDMDRAAKLFRDPLDREWIKRGREAAELDRVWVTYREVVALSRKPMHLAFGFTALQQEFRYMGLPVPLVRYLGEESVQGGELKAYLKPMSGP